MKKRVLPALLFSLFAGLAAPGASAAQFSGFYVFGDSLSDAGYYRPFLAGLGLPAPVVASLGRFTTNPGPVWSEIISSYYGYTPSPSNANNGNIFAQGGARVALDSASTPPGGAQRPVSTQINEYLARNGGAADPGALYAVWAGGNDFLQNFAAFSAGAITQDQLQANVLAAATAEIGQIARLRAAGARYILVFGLPDIGATPTAAAGGPASVAGATALSVGFNTTLFTGLAGTGIRAIPVDVFSLLSDVKTNAAAFGITNTTGIACGPFPPVTTSGNSQFCLTTNLVAPGADRTYLFADSVHPTAGTHRIVADFVKSLIEGPTQYGMLAEAALRTRESHVRAVSDGIAQGRMDKVGGFSVFVGGDSADVDYEQGRGNPGLRSRSKTGTVGVTMRATDAIILGAAFGSSRNRGTFSGDGGGFNIGENAWSLFASMKWGGFYGTGLVTLADLRYSDMHRNVVLGTVLRRAESRSEGSNSSANISAGYDFSFGRFTIGPTVAVTTQNVDVNAFDESGAGSAGLRIHKQQRKSEVWSAGLRASLALGRVTPWIRVTSDKERRDDERLVSAMPLTMAAIGSSYDIPAYRPDTSYVTGAIGMNGTIVPNVGFGVAYYKVESRSGVKEDGFQGTLSIRF